MKRERPFILSSEPLTTSQVRLDLLTEQGAEDRLTPLAEAGDTLHAYVAGIATLIAKGAGDWIDVLAAIDELTTAQRNVRSAHQHLVNAMADKRVRLPDPLAALAYPFAAEPAFGAEPDATGV